MYRLKLHSKTPMLQNNKRQMFLPAVRGKRKGETIDPQEQAALGCYPFGNGTFGHPTGGLRRAILDAAKGFKVGRFGANRALGSAMEIEPYDYFVLTDAKGEPLTEYAFHQDIVTNQNSSGRQMKTWPMWPDWHASLTLTLNERYWGEELMPMLHDILTDAGLAQGLGDYRSGTMRTPGLGIWGKFTWELEELEECSS